MFSRSQSIAHRVEIDLALGHYVTSTKFHKLAGRTWP
jgi:hypothetical protein